MNQGLEQQMPSFNLPSKILCKVVNVHLRVSYDFSPQSYWKTLFFFFLNVSHLFGNWSSYARIIIQLLNSSWLCRLNLKLMKYMHR